MFTATAIPVGVDQANDRLGEQVFRRDSLHESERLPRQCNYHGFPVPKEQIAFVLQGLKNELPTVCSMLVEFSF